MPVTVTDTPGRRRGVSDPLLRPVAVNCFMRNAANFAAVQAQIERSCALSCDNSLTVRR